MHWYTRDFGGRLEVQLLSIERVWGNRGECLCVPGLAGRVPAPPPPSPGDWARSCCTWKKRRRLLHLTGRRCYHTDLK